VSGRLRLRWSRFALLEGDAWHLNLACLRVVKLVASAAGTSTPLFSSHLSNDRSPTTSPQRRLPITHATPQRRRLHPPGGAGAAQGRKRDGGDRPAGWGWVPARCAGALDAVLCCAVLCCAVLCCAVLCCAVLCCAVLCWFACLCGSLLVVLGPHQSSQRQYESARSKITQQSTLNPPTQPTNLTQTPGHI